MAAYATVADVQARMTHAMTEQEQSICSNLLDDAGVVIDSFAPDASTDAKKLVSCRMVLRAMGDLDGGSQIPTGATQGSMSALGYQQSWTFGSSSGAAGELYLSKLEKQLLGLGNRIGSYSPVQELAPQPETEAAP